MHLQTDTILSRELDPAFARRARFILESLELKQNMKILEVGCGRGYYEKLLFTYDPSFFLTGVDLNREYLAKAKRYMSAPRVKFLLADASNLPFPDQSFDRVIATEVLEHISDDRRVLREIYRVLKPSGVAVITVPNANYPPLWDPLNWVLEHLLGVHVPSSIWWLAGIWADHVRLYTVQELKDTIQEETAFQLETIQVATHSCLPFSHFFLYGIGKNVVERGLVPSMHRFLYAARPSMLHRMAHDILYAFDGSNDRHLDENVSTVNIFVKVRR